MKFICFIWLFIFIPTTIYADAFSASCNKFNVPKKLVWAIAYTESRFNPYAINIAGKSYHPKSKDEALTLITYAEQNKLSYDIGMMQINNYWTKKLRLNPEYVLEPHVNIHIGVWILANEIAKHGLNWKAIAYYHTPLHKNPTRGYNYAVRVLQKMKQFK